MTARGYDTNSVAEAKKRAIDSVKQQITTSLNLLLKGVSKQFVEQMLTASLLRLVKLNVIDACKIDVDIQPGQRIKYVDCLPFDAVPGSALIKTQISATNNLNNLFENHETYEGIVISSDGSGKGVVFQHSPPDEVIVKCSIQIFPIPMSEYTLIEFRHKI